MTASRAETCYACDEPATSKEHFPPFSFFPEGHRNNLLTVPSCDTHNNKNSKDVEYAGNVISMQIGANDVGLQHFMDKGMRCFARRPHLITATFSDLHPIMLPDGPTGTFTVDIPRIDAVMIACVRALHFHRTGNKHNDWMIMLPSLQFKVHESTESQKQWNKTGRLFLL